MMDHIDHQVEVRNVDGQINAELLIWLFENTEIMGFKPGQVKVKQNKERQAALITFSDAQGILFKYVISKLKCDIKV